MLRLSTPLRFVALCTLLLLAAGPASAKAGSPASDALARGDAAYARRAEGAHDDHVSPEPIDAAIAAYEEAIEAAPEALEPRWKLLRAIYFKGDFVVAEGDRREVMEAGRDLAEETLALLAEAVEGVDGVDELREMEPEALSRAFAGESDAAPVFFWSAVNWGLWGESVGRFKAARQGVGGHIRDYARATLALDETYEEAGGHRVLGRLHAVAPKIPFITGWVDRGEALEHLERAWELAPGEPYNGLYLAEAILEHEPERRQEALGILRELAERTPRPSQPVEDTVILGRARHLLAEEAP